MYQFLKISANNCVLFHNFYSENARNLSLRY